MPTIGGLLGGGAAKRRRLISYKIDLFLIADRLPVELLKTAMWWIWLSDRQPDGTPRGDRELPDQRPLTLLTPASLGDFVGDFTEHDDESRRSVLIVGGMTDNSEPVLNPELLWKELRGLSEGTETCVSAFILQVGDLPYEEFVIDSMPPKVLSGLLLGLCQRLGVTLDSIKTSSGRSVLRRVLSSGSI